jgi:hypothetical protein
MQAVRLHATGSGSTLIKQMRNHLRIHSDNDNHDET